MRLSFDLRHAGHRDSIWPFSGTRRVALVISAVVLAPDARASDDIGHLREVVVRSLVWLVSAVVAGVVRDVILAVPAGLDLGDVAEQAGCAFVEADRDEDRLRLAAAASFGPQLLVLRAGFQPESGVLEEITSALRRGATPARLLSAPETIGQRLFPDRAPSVGLLASKATVIEAVSFAALARRVRRAAPLRGRATRIV